ncbi:MAG: efflux RND transporter periplasmic adaptor subunit [Ignavibacteria bacterium]|nr:efflux RND transporter periplasmic adaptor subunit [Ignavibacteria bacterium]
MNGVLKLFRRQSINGFFTNSKLTIDKTIDKLKLPSFFKNRKFQLIILVVLIGIVILLIKSSLTEELNIPTYEVKRGNFLVSITEAGEIRAKNSVSIVAPRIRGNLKITYLVPEGKYVKAGETVVQFDATEALTNLKDAQAKLEVALSERDKLQANHESQVRKLQSDLRSAELNYELSKLNLEQMKFEAEVKQQEARPQLQRNEISYNRAKQDVESQKIVQQSEMNNMNITIQQRKADVEKFQRELEMLTLTAPTEGLVVYEMNWNTGRKIQIGDAPWSGMTIISLPDLSEMESLTYVNEVDVSKIRKGLKVQVKLDAFQDSTFIGEIASVASLGKTKDYNSKIKVFEIGVTIKSKSEILKPGMTTSNKIIINEIPNVIYIPQEAVFEKLDKKIVYLKNGSGFDERVVEVGEKSENFIIITKGLEEGDEVALRDPTIKIEETTLSDEKGTTPSIPGTK